MGVTNLGRVQGGGFYYADYTPTDVDSSIMLGRELLKPNTVKALIGDHVVMANGSLWEITEFSEGELGVVLVLSRKTSIIGPQGEPGIGCSVNGEPTALDFTSDPQSQIDVLKKLYAVGCIYMSTNSTSPASLFGGTWERIKDRFLLGAGDSYGAGSTGGEASHTLTGEEMPTHTHSLNASTVTGSGNYDTSVFGGTRNGTIINGAIAAGGSQPHNNMPPYLAIYIWRRTA